MIGTKLVLWKESYVENAYKDILGISHPAHVVDKEFVVTITEIKKVPLMFGKGTGEGWKAITTDGKVFTCNWNVFPDDTMFPSFYWDVVEEDDGELWQPVDAMQAVRLREYLGKDGNICNPIHLPKIKG
jgi:hypothetical protein